MEICQRCCGTTLRRIIVIKHNRYQQNTLKMFIITRFSYKIAILAIMLCMELFKTIAICY